MKTTIHSRLIYSLLLLVVAFALLGALVAGCGGSSGSKQPGSGSQSGGTSTGGKTSTGKSSWG